MDPGQAVIAIVSHTPAWVFVLLAVLVALGAQAMRPRVISPRRMLITPAIFIAWGVISLVAKPYFSAMLAGDWIAAAAIGAVLGWSTSRFAGLRVDRAAGRVHLPGSTALMARVLTVFLIKYALSAAVAMNPDMIDRLAPWDIAVSGLMAGYFAGSLLKFRSRYRTAPDLVLPSPAFEGGIS